MKNRPFDKFYKEELYSLRGEAKDFARKYPAMASMLGEASTDPDTERLIEGVAYLNAMTRKKIEDDFPEILYELINVLFPHYLRTVPSLSVISFSPKPNAMQTIGVAAGTPVKSEPYNGVSCLFRTAWQMPIQPMTLLECGYARKGDTASELTMAFDLGQTDIATYDPASFDFYIDDNIGRATALASLFGTCLDKIEVLEEGKVAGQLPADSLRSLGFEERFTLFPYPGNAMGSYRLLQEYFLFPQKFRFFRMGNLGRLQGMIGSKRFSLRFVFSRAFGDFQTIAEQAIKLHCVPVVNLFDDEADAVRLRDSSGLIRVRLSGSNAEEGEIYDVRRVTGLRQGNPEDTVYTKFDQFSREPAFANMYQVVRKKSILDDSAEECYIELFHREAFEVDETLVIEVSATNGKIPEHLGIGDIHLPTEASPERVTFENIMIPTVRVESPIEQRNLWFLISHMTTNVLSINSADKLKEVLTHYIAEQSRDRAQVESNKKRVDAIVDFDRVPSTFIRRGVLLRGTKIRLSISREGFAGMGDMYLFLTVLHQFFALYTSINSFIELEAKEIISGETFRWPAKMGTQSIL